METLVPAREEDWDLGGVVRIHSSCMAFPPMAGGD